MNKHKAGRVARLVAQAVDAMTWRGHEVDHDRTLTSWPEGGRLRAVLYCKNCPAQVTVDTDPLPNGIDIGGDAVAVNCPIDTQYDVHFKLHGYFVVSAETRDMARKCVEALLSEDTLLEAEGVVGTGLRLEVTGVWS